MEAVDYFPLGSVMENGRGYSVNKFDQYFSESMSSMEARGVLFKLCEGCSPEELELLKEAHFRVFEKIISRELREGLEQGIMC
jgi:hypothetical protein